MNISYNRIVLTILSAAIIPRTSDKNGKLFLIVAMKIQ